MLLSETSESTRSQGNDDSIVNMGGECEVMSISSASGGKILDRKSVV